MTKPSAHAVARGSMGEEGVLTGARANAAIMSSAPPRSAPRPATHILDAAYCRSTSPCSPNRGSDRVASFCAVPHGVLRHTLTQPVCWAPSGNMSKKIT